MARGSAQAQVKPGGNPGRDGHGSHSRETQTHRYSAFRPALHHADEPPSRNYGPVIPGPTPCFHTFLPSRSSAQRISRDVGRMQRRLPGPFAPSRAAVPRGTLCPDSAAGDQRAGEARTSAASSSDPRRYFAAARVTAPRLPPPAHRRSNSRQLIYKRVRPAALRTASHVGAAANVRDGSPSATTAGRSRPGEHHGARVSAAGGHLQRR
jgi:hypothetical protein